MADSVRQISTVPDPIIGSWDDSRLSSRIRRIFWFFGITLGLTEAIATRFTMNVDGISYLDLGIAYLNHNWNAAANGYWSPLYPLLLGATIRLSRTPMYWESTVVHILNWIVFLVSMWAFELFLLEVCRRNRTAVRANDPARPLPEWVLQTWGYSLFLYAGLVWISVDIVTPDQFVAAVMYLVAALLLKQQGQNAGWGWHAVLGILLGVGYLVKAILLPVGLVILITIPFLATGEPFWRRFVRPALTAFLLAVVAAPLIIALSLSKGRLTSGETGKIAYAQMVDGLVNYRYWQGEGNLGTPKHPVRKLWSNPDVFEFATPVGGTYPLWYDASYWYDGVKARLDVTGQLRVLKGTLRLLAACLFEQAALIVVLVSLVFVDIGAYNYWREVAATWIVWIPAVVGIGLYVLIWFEARYVAGFLTIIGLACFGAIRLVPSAAARRVVLALALAAAAVNVFGVGLAATKNLYSSILKPRNLQWEVAQALAQSGIRPGDGVATLIDHRLGDYWAHLAQVKIVEDIPFEEAPRLASLDSDSRAELIRVLQNPGARAVITSPEPPQGTGLPWKRLGGTDYYSFSLTQGMQ